MPRSTNDPTKGIQDHQFGYVSRTANIKHLLYFVLYCTSVISLGCRNHNLPAQCFRSLCINLAWFNRHMCSWTCSYYH